MAKHLVAGMAGYSHPAAMASVQRVNEEWLAPIVPIRLGGIAVFDAAQLHGAVPVVYASSAAVYRDNANVPRTAYPKSITAGPGLAISTNL